jgi:hypothetical protein
MPTGTRRRGERRLASGRWEETKKRLRAKRAIRNVQRCGSFRYRQMERAYIPSRLPPDPRVECLERNFDAAIAAERPEDGELPRSCEKEEGVPWGRKGIEVT